MFQTAPFSSLAGCATRFGYAVSNPCGGASASSVGGGSASAMAQVAVGSADLPFGMSQGQVLAAALGGCALLVLVVAGVKRAVNRQGYETPKPASVNVSLNHIGPGDQGYRGF